MCITSSVQIVQYLYNVKLLNTKFTLNLITSSPYILLQSNRTTDKYQLLEKL